MPTRPELAQSYAAQIRQALASANNTKAASSNPQQYVVNTLYATFKDIARDLNRYQLEESDKQAILQSAGSILEVADSLEFYYATKCASNDQHVAAVVHIVNVLNGILGKP